MRMPCWQRSFTNCSASREAWLGSTSNSGQILWVTIADNGVHPSAACHIKVAISFRVKKVESTADMIIISPPIRRAAIAELRAMYFSAMKFSSNSHRHGCPRLHSGLAYHLPNSLIGNKYQPADGYLFYKLTRRTKNQLHQFAIVGKKENVP